MKRLSLATVILVLAAVPSAAESRFFLAAGAGYVRPDDAAYRTIYGGQAIAPELSAMVRMLQVMVGGMGPPFSPGR